jgi:hypothetical protein
MDRFVTFAIEMEGVVIEGRLLHSRYRGRAELACDL